MGGGGVFPGPCALSSCCASASAWLVGDHLSLGDPSPGAAAVLSVLLVLLVPLCLGAAVVNDFYIFFLNHIPSGSEINISSLGHEGELTLSLPLAPARCQAAKQCGFGCVWGTAGLDQCTRMEWTCSHHDSSTWPLAVGISTHRQESRGGGSLALERHRFVRAVPLRSRGDQENRRSPSSLLFFHSCSLEGGAQQDLAGCFSRCCRQPQGGPWGSKGSLSCPGCRTASVAQAGKVCSCV